MEAVETLKNREQILTLQSFLAEVPGAVFGNSDLCPIKHSFADGVYMREMFIPKGTILTGKIHNLVHLNILVSGTVEVATEDGIGEITGYCSFVTRAGIMKVMNAKTDCIFINVLPNPDNMQDIETPEKLDAFEKRFVSETYEEHYKFIEDKKMNSLNIKTLSE